MTWGVIPLPEHVGCNLDAIRSKELGHNHKVSKIGWVHIPCPHYHYAHIHNGKFTLHTNRSCASSEDDCKDNNIVVV